MAADPTPLELTFLGSGNAFGSEGRAFSSFLLNGRYLFDCGPTVLQQLHKLKLNTDAIDAIFISHFHADHFYGLPFVFLAAKYGGRSKDLTIVGPPGIAEKAEALVSIGYPDVAADQHAMAYRRRYVEVRDGCETNVEGLALTAARVIHVDEMESYGYRAKVGGKTIVYSGDTTLCSGLLRLVPEANVVVLECSCKEVPVHLTPEGVDTVKEHASPHTQFIVTHIDGHKHPKDYEGLIVAQDLATYTF